MRQPPFGRRQGGGPSDDVVDHRPDVGKFFDATRRRRVIDADREACRAIGVQPRNERFRWHVDATRDHRDGVGVSHQGGEGLEIPAGEEVADTPDDSARGGRRDDAAGFPVGVDAVQFAGQDKWFDERVVGMTQGDAGGRSRLGSGGGPADREVGGVGGVVGGGELHIPQSDRRVGPRVGAAHAEVVEPIGGVRRGGHQGLHRRLIGGRRGRGRGADQAGRLKRQVGSADEDQAAVQA